MSAPSNAREKFGGRGERRSAKRRKRYEDDDGEWRPGEDGEEDDGREEEAGDEDEEEDSETGDDAGNGRSGRARGSVGDSKEEKRSSGGCWGSWEDGKSTGVAHRFPLARGKGTRRTTKRSHVVDADLVAYLHIWLASRYPASRAKASKRPRGALTTICVLFPSSPPRAHTLSPHVRLYHSLLRAFFCA